MQFRAAEVSEAPAITALINAAFVVEKFFIDGDRIDVDGVREFFKKGEFLVAEDGAGISACVYIEPRGDRTYLGLLSVDPGRQGGGLGSKLMTFAEDRARSAGAQVMELRVVNLREELPEFCRKRGYAVDGMEEFHPDPPTKLPCHFINMSKRL